MEIQEQLTELVTEQKKFIAKADEELKTLGQARTETTEAIAAIRKSLDDVQKQADAIDLKLTTARFTGEQPPAKTLGQQVVESEEYQQLKSKDFVALRSKDGRIRMPITDPFAGRKSTITTSGIGGQTTGVMPLMRLPGITSLASQELRVRDLMTVRPMTSGNSFDYVKMLTRTNAPSPQVEGSAKAESTYAWTALSGTIKTIAHFTNVTRQAIEDVPWLQGAINSELMYGLLLKEEQEILSGVGTGEHLNGLITQATAYITGLDMTGDTKLDKLRHAKLQARLAGLATFAPDGMVLNPYDLEKIELIKTNEGTVANNGLYVIGDPKSGTQVKTIWGLPVVESDSIAQGTFLIGAFAAAAELIDRMSAMVEISYEHASNFTSNLATILCEERIGLAVRRPEAFITGSFSTTSP